jgi:Family of unknown function (DUF6011)
MTDSTATRVGWSKPLATAKQLAFLDKLIDERGTGPEQTWYSGARGRIDVAQASRVISALLKVPVAPKPAVAGSATAPASTLPDVPEGRYALRVDGVVKFYKLDRPTEGKWAGWVFLKAQASDDFYPIKDKAEKARIMGEIAKDPKAATELYGHELGICGVCGRTLTDEDSRARGIGPVCADARGWM